MVEKPGEGNAVADAFWFLGVMVLIAVVWFYSGGFERFKQTGTKGIFTDSKSSNNYGFPFFSRLGKSASSSDSSRGQTLSKQTDSKSTPAGQSPYYKKVSITRVVPHDRSGSIAEEYLILTASSRNKEPITITGWTLRNAGDQTYYEVNGKMVRGRVSSVVIPTGVLLGSLSAATLPGIIKLEPGGSAIISSGAVPSFDGRSPKYSYKVNKCTGYLGEIVDSAIYPVYSRKCPDPEKEVGANTLAKTCSDFVKRLSICHEPEIKRDREEGELVDGKKLSSTCKTYLKEHFNYEGCVKYHQTDPDFYTKEWRVYLRATWPLWGEDDDTISLYDAFGLLVTQKSY